MMMCVPDHSTGQQRHTPSSSQSVQLVRVAANSGNLESPKSSFPTPAARPPIARLLPPQKRAFRRLSARFTSVKDKGVSAEELRSCLLGLVLWKIFGGGE